MDAQASPPTNEISVLRVGPVSLGFQDTPGDAEVLLGLAPLRYGSVRACSLAQLCGLGKTCSSRTDCLVHLKYANEGNQG